MDAYPEGSLDHNVPFLVASGLNASHSGLSLDGDLKHQGILFRSEQPPLESREADILDNYFQEIDKKGKSWIGVERDEPFRFRIRSVGRSYLLPPRRAPRPESDEPSDSTAQLHSPFSPLSQVSSLYPDGLIDSQWIKKHQELVPSVFLCFFTISSDPTTTTLQDNRLKNDIADLKGTLAQSGYKSRLAIALLSDDDSTPATLSTGLQERLENIRRGSGLDAKSLFYIPPQESETELQHVADNVLTALYGPAVEYYRELGRHPRKKRSRGIAPQPTVPPTSGTSRTLSLPDWNFRYDFKSAILGEFRQEHDASMKSYEQAYEVLLGQDVLDVIPSWSPRWNEARLLADVIAIRCLRLHFWMGQTSLAVRRWQAHRERIEEFVDRRGRGTDNYGWEAWEARWAMVMADLMDKIEPQGLSLSSGLLYLPPEKAVLGDRLNPWELLHHKGYWYQIAARHLAGRRRLAHSIPDEDRIAPDNASESTASNYKYDNYLCPDPWDEYPLDGEGVNHAQLIVDCLILARTQFLARKQLRTAADLSLECAKEMSNMRSWNEVLSVLRPLWEDMTFRSEGWLDISEDMTWLLRRAAVEEGRGDLVVAADWELMNKKFTRRPKWPYDFSKSLSGMSISSPPTVRLTDDALASFVNTSFVFRNKESRAGDRITAQLAITSLAFPDAAPVALSEVRIAFEGGLKPVILKHEAPTDQEQQQATRISTLALEESFDSDSEDDLPLLLSGHCDLTLSPGKTLVAEMSVPLRESGEVTAKSATLCYRCDDFDMEYTMKLGCLNQNKAWYVEGSPKPRHARSEAHVLQVQPRPPKLDIRVVEPLSQYYASEPIRLQIQLQNDEEEAATVKLDAHLFGKSVPAFAIRTEKEECKADAAEEESRLTALPLGVLDKSATLDLTLVIDPAEAPTSYDLHLRATYHLESDAATPIMQMLPVTVTVVNPFEANYDLVPRLHLDAWPSLFDYENVAGADEEKKHHGPPMGVAQNWCLICHYASFASEDIKVVGIEMKILSGPSHARCSVAKQAEFPEEGLVVSPKTMQEARFDLTAQKMSLDDRHPVSLDLGVLIKWQRQNGKPHGPVNTTTLKAGNYLVLSTEPRVLASVFVTPAATSQPEGLIHLDITIENPSTHFLTFGLSMEPSDEFAFSGSKQTTVHLLPSSRRTATYRLLPLVRGQYVRPELAVRDKYFQKVLRIIPTEGMKIDKDGLLVWVPPIDGEEASLSSSSSSEKSD